MKPHVEGRTEGHHQVEPQVGGESARIIADTIRSFPVSLTRGGLPRLHNIATSKTRVMIRRAYERIEIEVMDDMANCSCPGEHRTLDVHEYEWLVYTDLMWKAKIALGETSRVEALWLSC